MVTVSQSGTIRSAVGVLAVTAVGFLVVTILNVKIPMILEPEMFGNWRTFVLVTSFSGVFHFGFVDGVLIRWMGTDKPNFSEFSQYFMPFLVMQIVVGVLLLLILSDIVKNQYLTTLIVLQIVMNNLSALVQTYYQSNKLYIIGTILNYATSLVILVLIIFLPQNSDTSSVKLISYSVIATFIITTAPLLIIFKKKFNLFSYKTIEVLAQNISVGLPILLSNLLITVFFALDKFVVRFFYGASVFGNYSFAANLISIVFAMVFSLTNIVLKYFFNSTDELMSKLYTSIVIAISLIWIAIIFSFPWISIIVQFNFPKYQASLSFLLTLLGTLGPGLIVQLFQINILKSRRMQVPFLKNSIFVLLGSMLIGYIVLNTIRSPLSVGIIISLSYFSWTVLNEALMLKSIKSFHNGLPQRAIVFSLGFLIYAGSLIWNKI